MKLFSIRHLAFRSISCTALLFFTGCSALGSLWESAEPQRAPGTITRTPAEPPGENAPHKIEGVEITWQVPIEAVDGFVIRYGYERTKLDSELKVPVGQLQQQTDTEYGPVFRYTIPEVKPNTNVFVSVAAFKGDRISDFSDVIQESSAKK